MRWGTGKEVGLGNGGELESVWGSPELDGDKCLEDKWWLGCLGFFS